MIVKTFAFFKNLSITFLPACKDDQSSDILISCVCFIVTVQLNNFYILFWYLKNIMFIICIANAEAFVLKCIVLFWYLCTY